MLQAILFDLDQTLIDRTATFSAFLEDQYERLISHPAETSKTSFLDTVFRYDNNGYTEKSEVYDTTCKALKINSVSSHELLADFKMNYGQKPVLFDGVHECLSVLQEKYQLALITNGRTKGQNFKIDQSGIRDYFSSIKISEEVGVKKPNPLIFESCINELEIAAKDCLYIGDHPFNDVIAAKEIGMLGVWVENEIYSAPTSHDGIVKKIADFPVLLEAMESRNK